MKNILLIAGIALFIQGCAYAVSRDVARKADKSLTFEQLLSDPESYKGKITILGGTIVRTKNIRQGTIIEVVQKPLDYWGKPKRTDRTGGTFLLLYPGYLDAVVYSPGREITAAAEVAGTQQKALWEIEYDYPLLISKELKLWEKAPASWDRPQWWDPLYDPNGPVRMTW